MKQLNPDSFKGPHNVQCATKKKLLEINEIGKCDSHSGKKWSAEHTSLQDDPDVGIEGQVS